MTRVRTFLFIGGLWALCAFCALSAVGAPPRRIPIEDFFRDPQFASTQISPDGKRIAFLAPDRNRLNIWICDAGASFDSAKLVTHETLRGIWEFTWTRDSRFLLYSLDSGGDENFHLFRADPSAPEKPAVDLTPLKGTQAKLLRLPRNTPGEAWIEWNNRDSRYFDAVLLNIATGACKAVANHLPAEHCLLWNSVGVITAYLHFTANGMVDVKALDSGSATHPRKLSLARNAPLSIAQTAPISNRAPQPPDESYLTVAAYKSEDNVKLWGFDADRSTLYLSVSRNLATNRLTALDTRTGEETVVAEDPEYDLSKVFTSERTGKILGVAYEKERYAITPLAPELKRDLAIISRTLAGSIHFGAATDDEQKWIVDTESPTDPASVYLYDRASGALQFLDRPYPWLKPEELAEMKPIAFESRDGWKLHGYLSLPPGVEPRALPTILIVHGGPWTRNKWGYDPLVQFLANRGFAVLQIDFRGSEGYGEKFCLAGDREWGGKMLDDVIDGANWAVGKGIADPKRLGIYGSSFGGYTVLSALAFHPEVFACGVDLCGPSNLITFWQNTPSYWADDRNYFIRHVGDPQKDANFLRSRSPLFFVNKFQAPVFIAQGENDPRVKRSEADQMVEALRANGKPVEYLLMPDEGHGFQKPENRIEFTAKMEAFLEKYLKPSVANRESK